MKKLIILSVLLSSSVAFSGVIKTCKTTLTMPDSPSIPSVFEIIDEAGAIKAKVTQKVEGQTNSYEDTAAISEHTVKEGLAEASDPETLNLAENLVVHSMTLEGMGMKSGVSLTKVRSAKIYSIGEVTNMGGTAIVEARDGKGKVLGSYLGGFLVSPCK